MLLDEKVQTRKDISSALPFALSDISELTGLPMEVLKETSGSVISFKPRYQPEQQNDDEDYIESESTDATNVFEFRQKG